MLYNTKILIILLLSVLLFAGVCIVLAEGLSDVIGQTAGSSECDMKKKIKAPRCIQCRKILMGLKCTDCGREKNPCEKCRHLFSPEEVKNNQCPCCGQSKLVETQLVNQDKCFFCNESFEIIDACAKQVYACPEHPDYQDLKAGACRERIADAKDNKKICGKKLGLTRTVYSEIIERYICPKCRLTQEQPGKCDACNQPLIKKKLCNDSGVFPHINEAEWGKSIEKYGDNQDKLVLASKPELKVFEGARQPKLKCWTYLIYCNQTKEAVLIDASCDADELVKYLEDKKLHLKYIIITHSHGDHFVSLGQIQSKCRDVKVLKYESPLKDNNYIELGNLVLKIFHTPGHAADCIVIWVGRMLFTGDSFDEDVGREETKKRLKGKGGFPINGGHGIWQDGF